MLYANPLYPTKGRHRFLCHKNPAQTLSRSKFDLLYKFTLIFTSGGGV